MSDFQQAITQRKIDVQKTKGNCRLKYPVSSLVLPVYSLVQLYFVLNRNLVVYAIQCVANFFKETLLRMKKIHVKIVIHAYILQMMLKKNVLLGRESKPST